MGYRSLTTVGSVMFGSIIACTANPALAVDHLGTKGGWEVFKADESCVMLMEFEGPGSTNLMFLKSIRNEIVLQVTNSEWSTKEDSKYDISYRLNGQTYSGGTSVGIKVNYRSGFMTIFENDFEQAVAAGSSLHIYLAETRIDQLSLDGTAVALNLVNSCIAKLKDEHAAAEKEQRKWAHLPRDPFQDAAEEVRGPIPRANGIGWANASDYPSAALREEREGRTGFRLTVNSMGRVSKCEITESSGHADLDTTTCTNITRRARFKPAIGENGVPIAGTWESSLTWSIPR